MIYKKKRQYSAAVIGCGNIGADESIYSSIVKPGTHAGAYHNFSRIKLVALVDSDNNQLKKMQRRYPEAQMYTSIEAMVKENKPDIVSVASPTKYHKQHVSLLSSYKIPVIFCEKPIAHNIVDAKKMIIDCRKSKSQLFINHQRRFDPLLMKWSKKVKKGILGEIYCADAYYYNGLFNAGTHLIDLIRMFLGEPKAVSGRYNHVTSSKKEDLNVDGTIFFNNQINVYLHSLSKNYGHFGLTIYGDRGVLIVDNLGFRIVFKKKVSNDLFRGYFKLADSSLTEGKPRSYFTGVTKYLVDYLDGQTESVSTGEDALKDLKILIALERSATSYGREILIK